jgi:hypothetical protein
MQYVPYPRLDGRPNVVVDGASNPSTVLNLSHWPKSGTDARLKDDLSAQIVFRYGNRRASFGRRRCETPARGPLGLRPAPRRVPPRARNTNVC